jgi:hypothetical protein
MDAGSFAANLEPKDSTLAEYRAKVEKDFREVMSDELLTVAMAAFDLGIQDQEKHSCLRAVPPMARLGTYPDDVINRAIDVGADRAKQPRGRSSVQQHRAKFEYELRHGLCGAATPGLIGWFLAGFDDAAGLPMNLEGAAYPAFTRNLKTSIAN